VSRRLLAVLAGAAALAAVSAAPSGCMPGLVQPSEADVSWAATHSPGATMEDLRRGRAAYVAHCAGCHDLHRPQEFPPERWSALVDEMVVDAKLSPADRDAVVLFLRTTSTRLRGETVAPPPGAARGEPAPATRR
jgi:mono/diheme cytochrome c family protein